MGNARVSYKEIEEIIQESPDGIVDLTGRKLIGVNTDLDDDESAVNAKALHLKTGSFTISESVLNQAFIFSKAVSHLFLDYPQGSEITIQRYAYDGVDTVKFFKWVDGVKELEFTLYPTETIGTTHIYKYGNNVIHVDTSLYLGTPFGTGTHTGVIAKIDPSDPKLLVNSVAIEEVSTRASKLNLEAEMVFLNSISTPISIIASPPSITFQAGTYLFNEKYGHVVLPSTLVFDLSEATLPGYNLFAFYYNWENTTIEISQNIDPASIRAYLGYWRRGTDGYSFRANYISFNGESRQSFFPYENHYTKEETDLKMIPTPLYAEAYQDADISTTAVSFLQSIIYAKLDYPIDTVVSIQKYNYAGDTGLIVVYVWNEGMTSFVYTAMYLYEQVGNVLKYKSGNSVVYLDSSLDSGLVLGTSSFTNIVFKKSCFITDASIEQLAAKINTLNSKINYFEESELGTINNTALQIANAVLFASFDYSFGSIISIQRYNLSSATENLKLYTWNGSLVNTGSIELIRIETVGGITKFQLNNNIIYLDESDLSELHLGTGTFSGVIIANVALVDRSPASTLAIAGLSDRVEELENEGTSDITLFKLIMGDQLYCIDGEPLALYRTSFTPISTVSKLCLLERALLDHHTDYSFNLPKYNYFEDVLMYDSGINKVSSCDIVAVNKLKTEMYGNLGITVNRVTKEAITGQAVSYLPYGASNTGFGWGRYVKEYLTPLGVTVTTIGVLSQAGESGEGRGGWGYMTYIGKKPWNQEFDVSYDPLDIGKGTHNPFMKVATLDDLINNPTYCYPDYTFADPITHYVLNYTEFKAAGNSTAGVTFYIWDFVWYMATWGITAPDTMTIQLGLNDSNPQDTSAYALPFMLESIFLGAPNCKVGMTPSPAVKSGSYDAYMLAYADYNNWLNTYVAGYGNPNLSIVNLALSMNRDFDYHFATLVNTSIDDTGSLTKTILTATDGMHSDNNGFLEIGKCLGAFIANQI